MLYISSQLFNVHRFTNRSTYTLLLCTRFHLCLIPRRHLPPVLLGATAGQPFFALFDSSSVLPSVFCHVSSTKATQSSFRTLNVDAYATETLTFQDVLSSLSIILCQLHQTKRLVLTQSLQRHRMSLISLYLVLVS